MFDLNILHMLVFSQSFIVDFEAPPELHPRRHGCQKMRLVLRHNESGHRPRAHAHSEQRSRFLVKVREKSASFLRRTERVTGSFLATYIRFCATPQGLMFLFASCAFVMSIIKLGFTVVGIGGDGGGDAFFLLKVREKSAFHFLRILFHAHGWFRFRVPDVFFLGETQGFGIVALFSPLAWRILLLMRQEVAAADGAACAVGDVGGARVSPHVDSCMAAADTNKSV